MKFCIAYLFAYYLDYYNCYIYTVLLYFFRMPLQKTISMDKTWTNRKMVVLNGLRKSSRRWVGNKFQNIQGKLCITSRNDTTTYTNAIIKNSNRCNSSRKTCSGNTVLLKRPKINANDHKFIWNNQKYCWWNNLQDMFDLNPQWMNRDNKSASWDDKQVKEWSQKMYRVG